VVVEVDAVGTELLQGATGANDRLAHREGVKSRPVAVRWFSRACSGKVC
jgi:hypothetical protein